jgi:hypothetical protein
MPTPRSARCTCGPSSTCGATARRRCAHRRGSVGAGAQVQGRLQRRARRRPVPRRVDQVAVRPEDHDAFGEIKQLFDPLDLLSPQRMVNPPRMDDTRLMRFPPTYKVIPLQPALDWSAWDVQNDPGDRADHRAGHRRRPGPGLRQGGGDVQQQRPLPQVRRRHHVPELPRHARRAAPDARPRQHLAPGLSGQLGPETAFTSEAVREAWTSAWAARAASATAPPASTWRA